MTPDVTLRHRDALMVISKRVAVTLQQLPTTLGPALSDVYSHVSRHGVAPQGPPFVIYHDTPSPDRPFDIEICAPVVHAIDPPAGWKMQELPAGSFVSLVHVGPYDTLGDAYDTLRQWIPDHDLAFAGAPREVYLSEPSTPPDQVRTVVEFPVEKILTPVAG